MSKKIIKPEGMELINYLNRGYAVCNQCGAVMDRKQDAKGGCDIYICPACKWEIDEMDYEYEHEGEKEWTSELFGLYKGDIPPSGCRACGGPYPYCKTSCKLFDE